VDFRLLGPFEVADDSGPIPLRGDKQRAVLARLLLEPGRVVSTDRLIDALWGEQPPRTAPTSLQNFVSQLRKVLGPDAVATKPPGYVLHAERDQLDIARFEQLVVEARTKDGPDRRSERLREALSLWRGPPLADFAFEAWAQPEIMRLEELRLSALEDRIEADLEAGRHAELVGELESLVAEHPLREGLRGQLMLALYRSGRQADALDAFQEARQTLVAELGLEPGPSLQTLHRRIIQQEVPAPAAAAEPLRADHYDDVLGALLAGRLVPLLGCDVGNVAAHLAGRFEYPHASSPELTRISQYVAITRGSGPLHDELHDLFAADARATAVHRFLATVPPLLRASGAPQPLIVTTSYDIALEQAFADAGEEVEIVSYLSTGRHRGKFCHLAANGTATLIEIPNTYTEIPLGERPVILKLHGQVDRTPAREWESFVVTEDDYIDYLAATDLANLIPVEIAARLRRSHFLFLGYRMQEWNLRVILNRIWRDQKLTYRSWAVDPGAGVLDRAFWRSRDVDVLDIAVDEYVGGLAARATSERAVAV
jgi:DNA-binding SARP family transcriptional activator